MKLARGEITAKAEGCQDQAGLLVSGERRGVSVLELLKPMTTNRVTSNNGDLFSHGPGGQKSGHEVSAGLCSLWGREVWGLWGESLFALSCS